MLILTLLWGSPRKRVYWLSVESGKDMWVLEYRVVEVKSVKVKTDIWWWGV